MIRFSAQLCALFILISLWLLSTPGWAMNPPRLSLGTDQNPKQSAVQQQQPPVSIGTAPASANQKKQTTRLRKTHSKLQPHPDFVTVRIVQVTPAVAAPTDLVTLKLEPPLPSDTLARAFIGDGQIKLSSVPQSFESSSDGELSFFVSQDQPPGYYSVSLNGKVKGTSAQLLKIVAPGASQLALIDRLKNRFDVTHFEIVRAQPDPILGDQLASFIFRIDADSSLTTQDAQTLFDERVNSLAVEMDGKRLALNAKSASIDSFKQGSMSSYSGKFQHNIYYSYSIVGTVTAAISNSEIPHPSFTWADTSPHSFRLLGSGPGMTSQPATLYITNATWVQYAKRLTIPLFAVLAAGWAAIYASRRLQVGPTILSRIRKHLPLWAYLFLESILSKKTSSAELRPPANRSQSPNRDATVARLPDVPRGLLGALDNKQALLVLGSGASAQAGYPTGSQLLAALLSRLESVMPPEVARALSESHGEAGADKGRNSGNYNREMEALVSAVQRSRVVTEIQAVFESVTATRRLYDLLARLPWQSVLSLNWDGLAENVFPVGQKATNWQRFGLENASKLAAAIRSNRRCLLRPFGELQRPQTLSLSMEEFRRNLSRSPDFQRGLGLLLQAQTFFFVGASPDTIDQFLRAVAPELSISESKHFALVPADSRNSLWESTLRRYGVRLLQYQVDETHSALSSFVFKILENLSASPNEAAEGAPRKKLSARRIESIRLQNVGLFESLELRFQTRCRPFSTPPTDGAAELTQNVDAIPWTVIFGNNGSGKSSILKAIGLALMGDDPGGTSAASRLLKTGAFEGLIDLKLGDDQVKTVLYRDRSRVRVDSGQVTPVQAGVTLVLGFPALRGAPSKNPDGPSELAPHDPEPSDLAPLVNGDVDKRIESLKQWIVNSLDLAEKGHARASQIRSLLNSIICDIVPGDVTGLAPLAEGWRIAMTTSSGDVPFDDLSQGMISIFNWLGVVIQRLYDVYPDAENPAHEPAIVLIDEIDAHLHPDWQRRLVELARKYFPNVQVIATSHSPLLAGALQREEIIVLERDPDTREVTQIMVSQDTYGLGSDLLLTSSIFGLQVDRNPEAERQIIEYLRLFQKFKRTPEEEAQMVALEDQIRKIGFISQPRKVLNVDENALAALRSAMNATSGQSETSS